MFRQRLNAKRATLTLLSGVAVGFTVLAAEVREWKSGNAWQTPPRVEVDSATSIPSDAVVLFDGRNLDQWEGGQKWSVADGVATVGKGQITTKERFGDCQLHLEWASPDEVKGSGQGRGNSGVFFHGKYEVQILDSYDNETYVDGQAASIYKTKPPLVNACRKPGEWQTYDIIFTAPRFDEHQNLLKPGYVTVLHNGVVVQNHTELLGSTAWHKPPAYEPHGPRGQISLQDHNNPIRFRNIWLRELQELEVTRPE